MVFKTCAFIYYDEVNQLIIKIMNLTLFFSMNKIKRKFAKFIIRTYPALFVGTYVFCGVTPRDSKKKDITKFPLLIRWAARPNTTKIVVTLRGMLTFR
jgi:hypothetical protein